MSQEFDGFVAKKPKMDGTFHGSTQVKYVFLSKPLQAAANDLSSCLLSLTARKQVLTTMISWGVFDHGSSPRNAAIVDAFRELSSENIPAGIIRVPMLLERWRKSLPELEHAFCLNGLATKISSGSESISDDVPSGSDLSSVSRQLTFQETRRSVRLHTTSLIVHSTPDFRDSNENDRNKSKARKRRGCCADSTVPPDDHAVFTSQWFCPCCRCVHGSDQPRNAISPFRKSCGWHTNAVAKDGDCFYSSVFRALETQDSNNVVTVASLRCVVAAKITIEQLQFYQIFAEANPDAEWLDFVRKSNKRKHHLRVTSVKDLQNYIQYEGSVVGGSHCLWADDFAHSVVAQHLNLLILFIDMERSPGTTPYRVLACADRPQRAIILKRQGPVGHFVFLSCSSVTTEEESGCRSRAGEREIACFEAGKIPPMVQALWPFPEVTKLSKCTGMGEVSSPPPPPPPTAAAAAAAAAKPRGFVSGSSEDSGDEGTEEAEEPVKQKAGKAHGKVGRKKPSVKLYSSYSCSHLNWN